MVHSSFSQTRQQSTQAISKQKTSSAHEPVCPCSLACPPGSPRSVPLVSQEKENENQEKSCFSLSQRSRNNCSQRLSVPPGHAPAHAAAGGEPLRSVSEGPSCQPRGERGGRCRRGSGNRLPSSCVRKGTPGTSEVDARQGHLKEEQPTGHFLGQK